MMRQYFVVLCAALLLALSGFGGAAELRWQAQPGAGAARVNGQTLTLSLTAPGESALVGAPASVTGDARLGFAFQYRARDLSSDVKLLVAITWLDAQGRDIDALRAPLGFPPVSYRWYLSKNGAAWLEVADNVTAPGAATHARITFRLERSSTGKPAEVTIQHVRLEKGEVTPTGIDLPQSGLPDAGPLTPQPAGVTFGRNLAPNGTLEEGAQSPTGWKIIGDNSNGAASWRQGGAFSGKRCFQIFDRGPFVKSWGERDKTLYIHGGAPGGNYSGAREEVSARWISEPMPATPGRLYQASAFLWYANRQDLDRGNVNPVRILFLDRDGRIIPYRDIWEDWLPDALPFEMTSWVPTISKPLVAPDNTASVCVVVAMFHAFFNQEGGVINQRLDNRGFVLVDNIALYEVPTNRRLLKENKSVAILAREAYEDARAAGALPYIPTSAAFRPNTLRTESATDFPGGILFIDRAAARDTSTAPKRDLNLQVSNLIGDSRDVSISYEILDWHGASVYTGKVSAKITPYGRDRVPIDRPANLAFGAYHLRYTLTEGGKALDQGETRFAIMARKETSAAERGRMDYPFSLWNHKFAGAIGTDDEKEHGLLMDAAGMGKTWFGCGGPIYIDQYLAIKDPVERAKAIAKRLAVAREAIAAWKRYGVTPMGHIQDPQLQNPENYPVLAEIVSTFVTALKDDIHSWRYGTESMHGGVKELDRATMSAGQTNVQGGGNYLLWGRRGTVRQYWAEYFIAYAAAKKADPTCVFGPQCASDIEGNVLRLFFQLGSKDQIDSFGMNTYIGAFSIWPPNVAEMTKNGVPHLPLYISEFAAQNANPIGPQHYAKEADAVRQMVTYWTSMLYTFPNFFHAEQWGMILGNDDGSLTYLNRVRPQYVAYAVMTENLGAGRFIEKIEVPQGAVYVRERSMRAGLVGVMWSTGPETTAELEVGVPEVTVCDVMGNRRQVKTTNGVAVITLTPMPQYLLGAKTLRAASTVELTLQQATLDPSHPRLSVTVTNHRTDAVAGTLTLSQESAIKITPAGYQLAQLRPGETKTFTFDVTPLDATRDARLPIRARLRTPVRTFEAAGALNFQVAPMASPIIDGDLADWAQVSPLVVDRADQFRIMSGAQAWGGPSDLSGKLFLAWDAQHLYVAARVTDDTYVTAPKPGYEFNFDSIELLVDVTRGLRKEAPFQMVTLAGFPDNPRVRRYDGPLPKGEVTTARIIVKHVGAETIYEAAIPWGELAKGFTPAPGQTISAAFTFDDHDGGDSGRRGMSWFSAVTEKNAAAFGDITLTGAVQPHAAPTPPITNLLRNGDFEDRTAPPGEKMEGWNLWWARDEGPQNAECALTTEGAYQGRSLKITRLTPKSNMKIGGWNIPVQPGQRYLFRAMVKMSERAFHAWLAPLDANRKELLALAEMKALSPASDFVYGKGLRLTVATLGDRDAYHPMEGIIEIPDGATMLNIALAYNWASGTAYVDNCELYLLRP